TVHPPLVVDAERRGRPDLEPLAADRLAAALTDAIGPLVDARERLVDAGECLLRALLEPRAALALEGDRGGRRPRAPGASDLLVHRPLAVLAHRRERTHHTLPLRDEEPAELGSLDRVHASPPAADESRLSASSAERPSHATILSRDPWPATIETAFRG